MDEREQERQRFEDIVDAICAWHEEARASKVFSMPCVKRSGKVVFGLSRTGMVFKLTDPEVQREARPAQAAGSSPSGGTLERVEALEAEVRGLRERIERLEQRGE